MKKSISTFLKHPTKDSTNRSANPPVTRASTILFNSIQEMYQHELKIKKHKKFINLLISERDKGLYYAMNKGVNLASGDVVGFLNSDDIFMDDKCVEEIARSFTMEEEIDLVFGNILIVSQKDINKTITISILEPIKPDYSKEEFLGILEKTIYSELKLLN